MLGEPVGFQQVVEWIYVPDNQALHISSILLQKLRNKGIHQWPPHADKLPQCGTYRLQSRRRSHLGTTSSHVFIDCKLADMLALFCPELVAEFDRQFTHVMCAESDALHLAAPHVICIALICLACTLCS